MAFLAFLAFEIKNMAMAEFWGLKGPKKQKKLSGFDEIGWWPLIWPSKNFPAFFNFFGVFDA